MSGVPVIVGGAAKDAVPSVIIGGAEKKIYDAYVIISGAAKRVFTAGATVTSISSKLIQDSYSVFSGTPTITRDSNGLHYTLNWSKGKYGSSGALIYGNYETDITLDLGGAYSFINNSPGWNIKKQLTATWIGRQSNHDGGGLYIYGNGFTNNATVQLVTQSNGTIIQYPKTVNFQLTSQTITFNTLTFSFTFTIKESNNSSATGTIKFDIPNDAMSLLPSGADELPILFN